MYKHNINAISENKIGINFGAVYETVVAQKLSAYNHKPFYFVMFI